MWAAVAVGVFVRFWGLGDSPLSTDEFFITQSILNIRSHGLPMFECGGYYVRGLLQQYLTLPLVVLALDLEWAARVPPAILNILGMPAVYLLGRRLGGYAVGCAATLLYSLSIWEIEVARFARMYPFFQTAFLWHLVFLTRALVDGDRSALPWMYGISAVSVFLYEGAIFLVFLNFLPFLTGALRASVGQGLLNAILLAVTVIYRGIDFRHWGALSSLPPEMAAAAGESAASLPISLPPLLATALPASPGWLLAAGLPLAISLWALAGVWRSNGSPAVRLVWLVAIGCSALNLMGLLVFALGLALLGRPFVASSLAHIAAGHRRRALIAIGANFFFWIGFGVATTAGAPLPGDAAGGGPLERLFAVMLDYPQIYRKVIHPWGTAMPVMTGVILVVVGSVALRLMLRPRESDRTLRALVAVFCLLVLAVASLETSFHKARYTFFLYPLCLLLLCTAFQQISGWIPADSARAPVCWTLLGLLVVASEDFGYRHLRHITSPEVTFRTIYDPARQDLYFYRRDYASPAEYVNRHAAAGDVIVTRLMPALGLYLNRLDHVFVDRDWHLFGIYAACNGTREIWSNAELLHDEDELFRFIEESDRPIWLVLYTDDWRGREERILAELYGGFRVYTSVDGTIQVFRIPPRLERETSTGAGAV